MTALSKLKKNRAPRAHVLLPPEAFEETWSQRPTSPVAIGLRALSVGDLASCRLEAEREASGVYNERPEHATPMIDVLVEQYNEILLCELAARCCCNPNDVTLPYFDNAAVTIRLAVTSEGLRRIWDEYTLMVKGSGVEMAPANDAEVTLFGRAMRSDKVRDLLDVEGRKLVAHLLAKLNAALPDGAELDDDFMGEDDDVDEVEIDTEDDGPGGFMSGEETMHVAGGVEKH